MGGTVSREIVQGEEQGSSLDRLSLKCALGTKFQESKGR